MKQVIVLSNTTSPDGGMKLRYAFWLSVPVATRVAIPGFTSAYASATGPETTALQNGSVLEKVFTEDTSPGMTIAEIGAYLTTRYARYQADVNTVGTINKNYAGATWDGTTWSNLPS